MKHSGKPCDFWMGRVVAVATIHLMLFGISSFIMGNGTEYEAPPFSPLAQNLQFALSLPLVAPLVERNMGGFLTNFFGGAALLVALAIFVANSFIVGFAVDGYVRIMGRVYYLLRGRTMP